MSIPELQKNILATIAYYDGLNYPLTIFEIWKYLMKFSFLNSGCLKDKNGAENLNYSLSNIVRELSEYNMRRLIEEHQGFYFWRGRKEIVDKRIKANKISEAKIKRLRRAVWFLRFIPYVRMIGVTGRLSMKSASQQSDWDVLIVLKNGHIWTGRTLVTAFLQLIGKRRYGKKIKDRICLNHFITDESLEVITKEKFPEFSAHEFSFIFPIFDSGIFQKFQFRNSWIRNYCFNYYLAETKNLKTLEDNKITKNIRKVGEFFLNFKFLESWLANWQRKKIKRNPKTQLPGSFISVSDKHLVFLPKPQGSELLFYLKQKMENL